MRKDVSLGNIHTQMSESYFLGVLLAVAGGFLDAYTYATRGGVFANAQTGNVVLFAIHLAQGQLGSLLRYLIPIAAFALGVVVAEAVRDLFRPQTLLHWRQVLVAIEFLILLASAFIPQGSYDEVVNVAVSFVCALQVETFRKIQGCAGHYHVHRKSPQRHGSALSRAAQPGPGPSPPRPAILWHHSVLRPGRSHRGLGQRLARGAFCPAVLRIAAGRIYRHVFQL